MFEICIQIAIGKIVIQVKDLDIGDYGWNDMKFQRAIYPTSFHFNT